MVDVAQARAVDNDAAGDFTGIVCVGRAGSVEVDRVTTSLIQAGNQFVIVVEHGVIGRVAFVGSPQAVEADVLDFDSLVMHEHDMPATLSDRRIL